MVWDIVLLIVGMILLIKGADLFVEGSSYVAKKLKIPALIIGLTLVSIGTSLPELSVSVTSAAQGLNDMSFGNVIGSNIFNTFVVIGCSALFIPMTVSKGMFRYDIPILTGIYVLLIVFACLITPQELSLWEAIILVVLLVAYMAFLVIRGKKESQEEQEEQEEKKEEKSKPWWVEALFIVIGLAGIIFGGNFVVDSASSIAKACGMSELLVSLTIVAVGTSLPELVTSMVAAKKGEHDIAIGNAVGSCIFNILLILGISALIHPMHIDVSSYVDLGVMLLSILLVLAFVWKKRKVEKWQGIVMVVIYVAYLAYIILRNIYQF